MTQTENINRLKVNNYITDMKELPPEESGEKALHLPKKVVAVKAELSPRPTVTKRQEEPVKAPVGEKLLSGKVVIMGAVNLIIIGITIYLLTRLPIKSAELKTEKINEVKASGNFTSRMRSVEAELKMSGIMDALFLNENGAVSFVRDIDRLKTPGGSIQKVSFTSQFPVKDKLGYMGLPVVIELKGSWASIAPDLVKIQTLPYYFRPVSINASPVKDNETTILFEYGGILYVNDTFGKGKLITQ